MEYRLTIFSYPPSPASSLSPSPSSGRLFTPTKTTSNASPTKGEALVCDESELPESGDVLVKLGDEVLSDSDDDLFEDSGSFFDRPPSTTGSSRDTCHNDLAEETNTQEEPPAEEGDLIFVSSVQDPDQEEEDDLVFIIKTVAILLSLRQPSWDADVKSEKDDDEVVPMVEPCRDTTDSAAPEDEQISQDGLTTNGVVAAVQPDPKNPQSPSAEAADQSVSQAQVRVPKGTNLSAIPLATRKRVFFDTHRHLKRASLERILQRYYSSLPRDRSSKNCWLYSGSRLPRRKGSQALCMCVTFRDDGHPSTLYLNVLLVKMLLEDKLSREHIDGFVNEAWHVSHLCGNWTCLNTEHVVLEHGSINSKRNSCFRVVDGPCSHIPKCMKHLKLPLSLSGRVTEPHDSDDSTEKSGTCA